MSPERRRWLSFVRGAQGDLTALADAATRRLGEHDHVVLTRDGTRDLASLIALCARAVVLCDRLIASLSDSDDD